MRRQNYSLLGKFRDLLQEMLNFGKIWGSMGCSVYYVFRIIRIVLWGNGRLTLHDIKFDYE